MKKEKIVLASASPRRSELLHKITDDFEVIVSECEEIISSNNPKQLTMELSRQKAQAVATKHNKLKNTIVIGADTVVSVDGKILGKPVDSQDAYNMIEMLNGRTHQVSTGISLLGMDENGMIIKSESFAVTTQVSVASMTNSEIEEYINTEEPYDKAGAYGIQGVFAKYIEGIQGDYFNVVGLPIHSLYIALKNF